MIPETARRLLRSKPVQPIHILSSLRSSSHHKPLRCNYYILVSVALISILLASVVLYCIFIPPNWLVEWNNFESTNSAYTFWKSRVRTKVEVDNLTWKVRGPTLQASLAALEHTRGKSVFIGGLVHNSAATLPRSLALLDAIAGTFKSSVVGLYENDSTDGSAAVLAAWARRHPNAHNIHIISETLGAAPALSHGGQDKRRFAALAGYRNRYLDAYREHAPHADYLVIIDTDLFDMGMDAFLSSFTPAGLAHDWSIAGANGLFNDRRYYDRLALRTAQYPDTRKEHQSSQAGRVYEPSEPWLPVSSVFGGVAVYRGACVGACRYEADGDCEHVSFSRCVRSRPGCGKAFMNPAAVLDYALWLRKDVQFYFPSQLQALIRRHADRVREEHLRRVADGQGADGQGADGEGEGEVLLP